MLDVVVLGGGPAGLTAAILLARRGRRVTVLERTRYQRSRAGETFGGELWPLLEQVGVARALADVRPVPFRCVQSVWGEAALHERPSVLHPLGDGWHVDRRAFDAAFAGAARAAGVAVIEGSGRSDVVRADGGGFRVRTAGADDVRARFVVDASGRGAPATAALVPGRRWSQMDRLVAVIAPMTAPACTPEPLLLLETAEQGWWYSAPQPDGTLLLTLMTDSDLLPPHRALATFVEAGLARTEHTAGRVAGATIAAPPWIARADSGRLLPERGPGWRALGDAAFACDPLGGDGVQRAVRAAIDAAPEIDRALAGDVVDAAPPDAMRARFAAYLDVRARYYLREQRFADAPFWRRRHPIDVARAPLTLDPRTVVRTVAPHTADALVLADVEALLPPRAVRALLHRLRTPEPAHVALAALRADAPLDDRRLLVALQQCIERGLVAVDPAPTQTR